MLHLALRAFRSLAAVPARSSAVVESSQANWVPAPDVGRFTSGRWRRNPVPRVPQPGTWQSAPAPALDWFTVGAAQAEKRTTRGVPNRCLPGPAGAAELNSRRARREDPHREGARARPSMGGMTHPEHAGILVRRERRSKLWPLGVGWPCVRVRRDGPAVQQH